MARGIAPRRRGKGETGQRRRAARGHERAARSTEEAASVAVLDLEIVQDPIESAKAAGLAYVSDDEPGIRRKRAGKAFSYLDLRGKPIHDGEVLARIRRLAIPPAWTEVWICPRADGHIQATGRDARGRKQYRYHPRWQEVRDETKYHRMIAFGHALPVIRERTDRDMALPGLPREKVLATVVRLLEITMIRVGNDEYARNNHSFGLTTMHDEHVELQGDKISFHFRGKSGVEHEVDVRDRRLARIVKRCQDIPGHELFQYVGEGGQRQRIRSEDVNAYLRGITEQEFTAKDFRTWAGTMLAAQALEALEAFETQTQAKKNVVQAIESVAKRLGNTRSVCRKCYIHPAIIEAYMDRTLQDALGRRAEGLPAGEALWRLEPEEAAVMALLHERLAREQKTLEQQLEESLRAAG